MKEPSEVGVGETIFYALFSFAIGLLFGAAIHKQISSTPLDVYRGKTTLWITYRDSVAIDSTVVYKVR